MASGWGKLDSDRFYFLGLQHHWGQWLQPWNQKTFAPWKESYDKSRQRIKKQRHHCPQSPYSQSYGFYSTHVWMWELDQKRRPSAKELMLLNLVLEKTPQSPLDSKEIKPVNHKRKPILNNHWKDWCWSTNTLGTWPQEPTHWWRYIHKKDWRQRRRGQHRTRQLDGVTDSTDIHLSKLWETVKDRGAWRAAVHGVIKVMTWLNNNNHGDPICCFSYFYIF